MKLSQSTFLSSLAFCAALFVWRPVVADEPVAINSPDTGYRGIWYQVGPLESEYVYKYSGGLATYTAKHRPFAVYSPEVDKTFFCYGGAPENYIEQHDLTRDRMGALRVENALYHMVSYYDHKTGEVPRPTILLNKKTYDAHDNPVIALDEQGYIWIFSTSHGKARPVYIHRSDKHCSTTYHDRKQC